MKFRKEDGRNKRKRENEMKERMKERGRMT